MSQGWIKIHRQIKDCWIYDDKPFDRTHAWIDLLVRANHQDRKIALGNEIIEVKKGSFITSEVKLMDAWGWSKTKLRSFLKLLQEDKMIEIFADKKKTTINIVNYSVYQESENQEKTKEEPQQDYKKTIKRLKKDTNKNDKELKNEEEIKYTDDFERFYKIYPNPFNKEQTFTNWKNALKNDSIENIMKATRNYISFVNAKKTDKQYIVRSTNFIGKNKEYKGYLEAIVVVNGRNGVKEDTTELIRRVW